MRSIPPRLLAATAGVALAVAPARPAAARDLATLTPASLLAPGETEVAVLQNVYTQTRYYDDDGRRRDAGGRSTWATIWLSVTKGVSPRVNVALETSLRAVFDETARRREPPAETDRRIALAWIGLRAEFAPWPTRPGLSVETALRIPTAPHLDGRDGDDEDERAEGPFLDSGDVTALARLRWDRGLSRRAYLYGEAGGELRLDGDGPDGASTPLKLIPHLGLGNAVTLYAPLEVTTFWGGDATGNWSSQTGLGIKWRPARGLELEALAGTFPAGRNQGAGHAFNLGLRIVR